MSGHPAQPLVIDLVGTYAPLLGSDPVAARFPPHLALTAAEARTALADPHAVYSAVIVCLGSTSDERALVKLAGEQRPSTPLLVIESEGSAAAPGDRGELGALGAVAFFGAKTPYREILGRLNRRPDRSVVAPGAPPLLSEGDDYLPVGVDTIVPDVPFRFDLYVRISADRHVKILHAGDELTSERAIQYRMRGARQLYLHRLDYDEYVLHQERIAAAALDRGDGTESHRIAHLRAQGEAALHYMEGIGVGAASLRYAAEFAATTRKLVDRLDFNRSDQLRGFLADAAACEHGVGASLIGAVIVERLGMAAAGVVETYGLACLLHDLGMQAIKDVVDHEHVESMMEEQRKLFYQHPTIGADCLLGVRGIHESVLDGVARHHERRGGQGFSTREHHAERPLIAEVVGVSHEIHDLLPQMASKQPGELRAQIERRITLAFSRRVSEAVFAAFPTLRPKD